ncbi:unnamed protein product [Ectocarpus sp. 13 AM-2016]
MVRICRVALLVAMMASPVRIRSSRGVTAWTHTVIPTRVLTLIGSSSSSSMGRPGEEAMQAAGYLSVGGAFSPGGCRRRRSKRGRNGDDGDITRCFSTLGSKRQNSRPVGTDELTQTARDRATALVEAYIPTPATEGDLRCIEERQLRHKAGASSRSLGVSPNPCRHGFPQAFAFDPCGHKVSSGLFRLSCPLLVQAIDLLEDEGGIEDVNARLASEEGLREDFMAVNLAHGMLRRRLVTPDKLGMVEETIGKEGAERFLDSGITGVTPGKVRDAKCLHAHVADALMRGRSANAIGRATLELLEARGVRTDGGDRCSEQCNYRVEETADSWRYTPQKNKQKLQMKKVRRKHKKACITKKERERETKDDAVVDVDGGSGLPLNGVTAAASSCKNSSTGTNSARIRGDTGVRHDTTDGTGKPGDGGMEKGHGTMRLEKDPVAMRWR